MGDNTLVTNMSDKEKVGDVKPEIDSKEGTEVDTILKPVCIESSLENTTKDEQDLSLKSDSMEEGICTKPAEKEQSISEISKTPKRQAVRNSFFIEEDTIPDEVFSTKGARTNRLPRRRDSVNVFPPGCMGVKAEESVVQSPRRFLNASECWMRDSGHIESTPSKKRGCTAKTRNPLTGEGYDDNSNRNASHSRRQGNPLLGQGYDDADETEPRPRRIPPGGYCHKLW